MQYKNVCYTSNLVGPKAHNTIHVNMHILLKYLNQLVYFFPFSFWFETFPTCWLLKCRPAASLDFYYMVLRYTLSTYGTAMLNTIPVITFILSILLRWGKNFAFHLYWISFICTYIASIQERRILFIYKSIYKLHLLCLASFNWSSQKLGWKLYSMWTTSPNKTCISYDILF